MGMDCGLHPKVKLVIEKFHAGPPEYAKITKFSLWWFKFKQYLHILDMHVPSTHLHIYHVFSWTDCLSHMHIYTAQKPIGLCCIAPVLAAKCLGKVDSVLHSVRALHAQPAAPQIQLSCEIDCVAVCLCVCVCVCVCVLCVCVCVCARLSVVWS